MKKISICKMQVFKIKLPFFIIFVLICLNAKAQTDLIKNGDFSSTTSWSTSSSGSGNFYYNSKYPDGGHSNPGYAYAASSTGTAQTKLNAYLKI